MMKVAVVFACALTSCSRVDILSPYGSMEAVSPDEYGRPRSRQEPHEGVDVGADIGTRVIASAAGVVTLVEFVPDYGFDIQVTHDLISLTKDSKGARYVTSY